MSRAPLLAASSQQDRQSSRKGKKGVPGPEWPAPHTSDLGARGRRGRSCQIPRQPSQRPRRPGQAVRANPLMPYDPWGPPPSLGVPPHLEMHRARLRNTRTTRMTHIRKHCQFSGKKSQLHNTAQSHTHTPEGTFRFLASWPCYVPPSRLVGKAGAGERHLGASLWRKLRGEVLSLSEPGTDPGREESQIICTSAQHRPGLVLGTLLNLHNNPTVQPLFSPLYRCGNGGFQRLRP